MPRKKHAPKYAQTKHKKLPAPWLIAAGAAVLVGVIVLLVVLNLPPGIICCFPAALRRCVRMACGGL